MVGLLVGAGVGSSVGTGVEGWGVGESVGMLVDGWLVIVAEGFELGSDEGEVDG